MKDILEIYRYTFKYKAHAILVIVCNLLYVIFNLLSLALFVPFLQVIFKQVDAKVSLVVPRFDGTFTGFFEYAGKWYNYEMQVMSQSDPKGALMFVCISVLIAFFFKWK